MSRPPSRRAAKPTGGRKTGGRCGFTLIELLVVIALIAILAAILFPVFAQARETARRANCLSNGKQLAAGATLYAQDYDETLLPWIIDTGAPRDSARRDRETWVHLLQPYVKNGAPPRIDDLPAGANLPALGLFACPSFRPGAFMESANQPDCDGAGTVDSSDFPPRQYYAHYGIVLPNPPGPQGSCTQSDPYYNFTGSDPLFTGITGTLAQIQRPADTVLFTDGATWLSNRSNSAIGVFGGCEAATMHQDGGTHVFSDGHVRWIKGNSYHYLAQDPFGCWYRKFYTYDK
jgi:prepilin-type N-terminal cleavage/methylation domain-containing protein